ncbi:unnamed protein product [Closterium sp. NIES-54]
MIDVPHALAAPRHVPPQQIELLPFSCLFPRRTLARRHPSSEPLPPGPFPRAPSPGPLPPGPFPRAPSSGPLPPGPSPRAPSSGPLLPGPFPSPPSHPLLLLTLSALRILPPVEAFRVERVIRQQIELLRFSSLSPASSLGEPLPGGTLPPGPFPRAPSPRALPPDPFPSPPPIPFFSRPFPLRATWFSSGANYAAFEHKGMMQVMPLLIADSMAKSKPAEKEKRQREVAAFVAYASFYKALVGMTKHTDDTLDDVRAMAVT